MNLPGVSSVKLGVNFPTARISTMIAPIAAIVVSFLVLFLVVWPKFTNVLALRAENKDLVERVKKLGDKVNFLSSLDKVKLQQDLGYAESLLPSEKGTFSAIRQVELAAGNSGVVLSKLDVAPGAISESSGVTAPAGGLATTATDAAPKILIKISISSDYNSFLNFVSTISSFARVTSIEDLSLSTSSVPGEVAPIRSSMSVNAYWKARPTKLGQIESPVVSLTEPESARLAKVKDAISSGGFSSSTSMEVPSVPVGRSDLFAPF